MRQVEEKFSIHLIYLVTLKIYKHTLAILEDYVEGQLPHRAILFEKLSASPFVLIFIFSKQNGRWNKKRLTLVDWM